VDEQLKESRRPRPGPFPGFRQVALPPELENDSRSYTLPLELLGAVVDEIGEERFDPKSLDLDRQLSALNGDHTSRIGFHRCRPIRRNLLAEPSSSLIAFVELSEKIGQNWAGARNSARIRPHWSRRTNVSRGFARCAAAMPAG
jgi:hypothetical protein